MEGKLLLDALLERLPLLQSKGIGLGDDGNDIDNVGQLLQHNNVNWLEGVARGLDEEQAAVDARILDVTLTLGSELFSQVGGVLVLDILDNGVPATVVVDKISIAGGVDNVQAKTNVILLDDVRHRLDLGGGADNLVGVQSALGLDEVRGEDGVDEGRLAQTRLACSAQTRQSRECFRWSELELEPREQLTDADDIELESALQELALDLGGDAVETDMALGMDGSSGHRRHFFGGID